MWLFIAGLMVGGTIGIIAMCLLIAGRESEEKMYECECEKAQNDTPQMTSCAGKCGTEYDAL